VVPVPKEYKMVRLDMDAYEKMERVKEETGGEGVLLDPAVSECVRWLYVKVFGR